uniref:TATA box-binding protein-like 1 n=1 Tax=Lates calcarifer TaxID=8187 RepID=A0A4W6CP31_LATCA
MLLNVIATVKLGCRLDLNIIAHKARNVEYKPKVQKYQRRMIREPRTTATIYESGNIVCSGANSEDQSRVATRRYARIVQRLGFPVSFLNFKIQNLVATCSTFPVIRFCGFFTLHSYEPELFPGLFCSVIPGITATIFASGRLTLSGNCILEVLTILLLLRKF